MPSAAFKPHPASSERPQAPAGGLLRPPHTPGQEQGLCGGQAGRAAGRGGQEDGQAGRGGQEGKAGGQEHGQRKVGRPGAGWQGRRGDRQEGRAGRRAEKAEGS